MSEKMDMRRTLCWDCAKFAGGCSWSDHFEPVKGWDAERTVKRQYHEEPLHSFLVKNCPEFKRDAWDGGVKRMVYCGDCIHYKKGMCEKDGFPCGPSYYCKAGKKAEV